MNWHFLNSAVLWALPAALLPVLFHLLFKRPGRQVAFSDLRFLREILQKARPRKRLQEWLILLARVLALACLFLFFSRPVLHLGAPSGDSLRMVILLDASYSMQTVESGLSHWNRAVKMAEKALESLSEEDRSSLVVFSDRVEFVSGNLSGHHKDLIAKIRELKHTDRTTNFLPALESAYQILANSQAGNKTILILSDNAPNGWPKEAGSLEPSIRDFDSKVNLVFSRFPAASKNLSVRDVRAHSDYLGNRIQVDVEIANEGLEEARDSLVTLETKTDSDAKFQTQSEIPVTLKAGEKNVFTLRAPAAPGETLLGRVLLSPDALLADNEQFFSYRGEKRLKILCVEEPSGIQALTGESFFFREALSAPPSLFDITTVNTTELGRTQLKDIDVVVLINPGALDPKILEILSNFQVQGGSIFFSCGERTQNSELENLLPVNFGPAFSVRGLPVRTLPGFEDASFLEFGTNYNMEKISVEQGIESFLKEGSIPILSLSDNKPLLVFDLKRKTAVWLSSLDRKWNNAASKPVYAPLMRWILGVLSSRSSVSSETSLKVGEVYRKKMDATGSNIGWVLRSPSGMLIPFKQSYSEIVSETLEEKGFYAMTKSGSAARNFVVVGVDAGSGEGGLAQTTDADLDRFFPSSPKSRVQSGDSFDQQLLALLKGKEMTRIFIILASIFLLVEMFLTSRKIRTAVVLLAFMIAADLEGSAIPGNRFVLSQLKTSADGTEWDPYPLAARDIVSFLGQTTSVKPYPEQNVVTLTDGSLFKWPFLLLTGSGRISWSQEERENLKKFVSGGGLLLVEDRTGEKGGSFDHSFRSEMKKIFPEKKMTLLSREHAVYRSFYLLRTVGGRRLTNNFLECIDVDGRVAILYSQNDILGAWAKDLLGNYVFPCSPGGEAQRWESQKLMINIILYSLTGTYKTDKIHLPFIEEKLKK